MTINKVSQTFYDLNTEIYNPYVEFIWGFFSNASSLYIRGSSSKDYDIVKYKPWDIDFVLGINGEQVDTKKEIQLFYDELLKINYKLKPEPAIDIRIVNLNVDNENIKYLHTLLLLKDSSRLIKGKSIDLSPLDLMTIPQKKKILNLYVKSFFNKKFVLVSDIKNSLYDTEVYNQKYERIIKIFFRIGALMNYVCTNDFSRSIDLGFEFWISISNPKDIKSIVYIINSLNEKNYNLELLDLCTSIVNRYILNDLVSL